MNRLAELRAGHRVRNPGTDYSQQGIALRVGVHRVTYSQWERGLRLPGLLQALRLAGIFGVSVEQLGFEEEEEET